MQERSHVPAGHEICELGMAVAGEQLDAICSHVCGDMWWFSVWFVVHMVKAERVGGPKKLAEVTRSGPAIGARQMISPSAEHQPQ